MVRGVYFYFGGFGVIATTPTGELLWQRKFPSSKRAIFGMGASPALLGDGGLILQRDGASPSVIVCLDTKGWRGSMERAPPRIHYELFLAVCVAEFTPHGGHRGGDQYTT